MVAHSRERKRRARTHVHAMRARKHPQHGQVGLPTSQPSSPHYHQQQAVYCGHPMRHDAKKKVREAGSDAGQNVAPGNILPVPHIGRRLGLTTNDQVYQASPHPPSLDRVVWRYQQRLPAKPSTFVHAALERTRLESVAGLCECRIKPLSPSLLSDRPVRARPGQRKEHTWGQGGR